MATAANSDIIVSIIMVIFGLILTLMGLLMLVVARQLIKGEISRKNYMGRGIKIKEAFASDEAWYRINRGGGKLMIFPSLALMALGVLLVLCPFIFPGSVKAVVIIALVCIVITALPLFGYVIWVKHTEPKRKAA